MKESLFTSLLLLLISFTLQAQTSDTTNTLKTKIIKKDVKKKTYDSDKIIAFVNGYKTSIEIMSLFSPDEITLEPKRDHTVSMDSLVMQIHVKDADHPVLRYFKNKAHIVYLDREYEHNVIPQMIHDKIYKLAYHPYATKFDAGLNDVLEVTVFGEEASPPNTTKYVSKLSKPAYYDIDGKIYTEEEKKKSNIKFYIDQYEMKGVIRGKEAAEKYGDPKYAIGVLVVRSINK